MMMLKVVEPMVQSIQTICWFLNLKHNYRDDKELGIQLKRWWGTQAFQHSVKRGDLNNGSKYCWNSSSAVLSAEGEIWAVGKNVVETILYSGILKPDGAGHIFHSDNKDICEAWEINYCPMCFCQHQKSTFLWWLVARVWLHFCHNLLFHECI